MYVGPQLRPALNLDLSLPSPLLFISFYITSNIISTNRFFFMEDSNKLEEGFGPGPHLASKNEQLEGDRGAAHDVSIEAETKGTTTSEGQPVKSKRVATLDAFRGLTIVV